ncbi:hypothetical protein RTZ71_18400 [Rhodococcus qingshengii]|uniref:hypothetical protein n=1 Tax=Rhodococcus qingshengii TaxID=334542 RepID=UPI0028F2EF07|nr:hypothetical protein [Rhodococcus qingshengii]MDT9662680.1 hypothetical protein [Rhodococcus qingshengii]
MTFLTRACPLLADTMMNEERCDKYATEVSDGVLVVTGCDAAPLIETAEAALDGIAFAVAVLVERGRATTF